MGFAILRTQKLKDKGSIRRSLKHAFREQETPNADSSRTPENTHIGAESVAHAMERLNERLPDKIRKNGVLAIEYLVTGSPEDMKGKTRDEQDRYFVDALDWLKERHGSEHIVYAGVHRDETTPHMYAYVVPIDTKGKLNCRAFLGGSKALSEMQTDFAERVGKKHGLQRGIEGSRAKHQRVKQFYAQVNQPDQAIETPTERQLLKKGFISSEYESDKQFADRITENVKQQLKPTIEKAKVSATESRRSRELQQTNTKLRDKLKRLQKPFQGLTDDQVKIVLDQANRFKRQNEKDRSRSLVQKRGRGSGISR